MENGFVSDHRQHSGGQLVLRGEEARLHGRAKDHRDRALHAGGETLSMSWQLCEGSSIKDAHFEGEGSIVKEGSQIQKSLLEVLTTQVASK